MPSAEFFRETFPAKGVADGTAYRLVTDGADGPLVAAEETDDGQAVGGEVVEVQSADRQGREGDRTDSDGRDGDRTAGDELDRDRADGDELDRDRTDGNDPETSGDCDVDATDA